MNVALLVGISRYNNLENLPGCDNDIEAVSKLLDLTKKYSKVAVINKNETAARVKEEILSFFEEIEHHEIEEFFFYYTGHGEFVDDNFFYLLSDYDNKRKNSTSFQNDFIDNLIRTLGPKLTVKLIDACQSGESYIKSTETVKDYFKSTAGKLKNCYFLSSSQSDQASWLRKFSSFTQAFLESIKDSQTNEVRYLSIIDYVTDYFEKNPEQRPFYITQGSFTEKFCQLNDEIRKYLQLTLDGGTNTGTKGTYIDIILEQGKKFLIKEDVEKFMNDTRNYFNNYQFNDELNQIYEIKVEEIEDKSEYTMDFKPIGTWLSKATDNYFAKPKLVTRRVQTSTEDGKTVNNPVKIIVDYSNTIELELEGISMIFNSKIGNVISYDLTYMFVVSRTEIRIFKSFAPFTDTGWDNRELSHNLKWRVLLVSKKVLGDIDSFWKTEIEQVIDDLKGILRKQFDSNFNPDVGTQLESDAIIE